MRCYVSRVQASAAQKYYFFHGKTEILWIVIVISAVSCHYYLYLLIANYYWIVSINKMYLTTIRFLIALAHQSIQGSQYETLSVEVSDAQTR